MLHKTARLWLMVAVFATVLSGGICGSSALAQISSGGGGGSSGPGSPSGVGGGLDLDGSQLNFSTSRNGPDAYFNVNLQSGVNQINSANVWLSRNGSRPDGLIPFDVNVSIYGKPGGPLNQDNYGWSLSYPSGNNPIVNLYTGLSWYSYFNGQEIIAQNNATGNGHLLNVMWDGNAQASESHWHDDWSNTDQFGWNISIPGHFTTAASGAAVFGVPEPASMLMFGIASVATTYRRRRRISSIQN